MEIGAIEEFRTPQGHTKWPCAWTCGPRSKAKQLGDTNETPFPHDYRGLLGEKNSRQNHVTNDPFPFGDASWPRKSRPHQAFTRDYPATPNPEDFPKKNHPHYEYSPCPYPKIKNPFANREKIPPHQDEWPQTHYPHQRYTPTPPDTISRSLRSAMESVWSDPNSKLNYFINRNNKQSKEPTKETYSDSEKQTKMDKSEIKTEKNEIKIDKKVIRIDKNEINIDEKEIKMDKNETSKPESLESTESIYPKIHPKPEENTPPQKQR